VRTKRGGGTLQLGVWIVERGGESRWRVQSKELLKMKMTVYSTPYMQMCMNAGRKGQEKTGQVRIGRSGQERQVSNGVRCAQPPLGSAPRSLAGGRRCVGKRCPARYLQ
jgi:hypothetical protein